MPKITQQIRQIAAEHLRRDNQRQGKEVWESGVVGEVLAGKRDNSPVVQIVADTVDQLRAA